MPRLSLGNAAARLSLVLSDLNSGLDAAALHCTCRGSYAYGAKNTSFLNAILPRKTEYQKLFQPGFQPRIKGKLQAYNRYNLNQSNTKFTHINYAQKFTYNTLKV